MQLFILGIIIYLFIRNKSYGYKAATLGLMILIGMISPVLHVWSMDLNGLAMAKPEWVTYLLL